MGKTHPNILFILSDQHRFCDVGYAGNDQLATPHLDRLAAESAVFDHAYSNCPVCVPARGTLLTGLHACRHGAASNDLPVYPDAPSIARALNGAGYQTAYVGKWHLGGVPRDRFIPEEERLGFQYWRGCNCNHDYMNAYYDDNDNRRHPIEGYEPIAQTTLALDYLQSRKGDEAPWALWLCFGTPHDPYLRMPEADVARCHERAKDIRLRGNAMDYVEFDYEPTGDHHAALAPGEPEPPMMRFFRTRRAQFENLPLDYAGYYRHIEYIDEQVGRVLKYLDENNLAEDTIVVYTSDHGNMLGSHGLINKQWYHEESARIPFVIRWPGQIQPGHRDDALSLVDVTPSLLGLSGARCDYDFDGRDLSDVMRSPGAASHDFVYLYSLIPAHQAWRREVFSWRAITDGHVIYAANQDASPLACYDLDADPLEMNNLIGQSPEGLGELQNLLQSQVERHDGFKPWQALTKEKGLLDAWNKSQVYFGFSPTLVTDDMERR